MTVTCRTLGEEETFYFKILGLNPSDQVAKDYIQGHDNGHWYAYAIARKESFVNGEYYCQFNPPGAGYEYEPDKDGTAGADGFGMMMPDPPDNRDQLWNWKSNVLEGIQRLDTKRGYAASYFSAVQRTYPNEYEPCTETVTARPLIAIDAATIQLYNGGAVTDKLYILGHAPPEPLVLAGEALETQPQTASIYPSCWRFLPNNASGERWVFVANGNNYVQEVVEEMD